MRHAIVAVQLLTFVALGVVLLVDGEARLGWAQLLLAVITVLLYA